MPRSEVPPEFSTPQSRVHGEVVATDIWDERDQDLNIDDMADPNALTAEALAIRAEELHPKRLLARDVALARWSPLLILGLRQSWPIKPEPDGRGAYEAATTAGESRLETGARPDEGRSKGEMKCSRNRPGPRS